MPTPDPGFDRARYARDPDYRAKILEFTDLREEIQAREVYDLSRGFKEANEVPAVKP
jgi:hypothetical protein